MKNYIYKNFSPSLHHINLFAIPSAAQDFTFTNQISGRPIGLAEAGDCCSQIQCIQGSFQLNITGTMLEITRTQKWVDKFHSAVKIIIKQPVSTHYRGSVSTTNRTASPDNKRVTYLQGPQVIMGKCGGSCGSCTLRKGRLKLQVQPPWSPRWEGEPERSLPWNIDLKKFGHFTNR